MFSFAIEFFFAFLWEQIKKNLVGNILCRDMLGKCCGKNFHQVENSFQKYVEAFNLVCLVDLIIF